MAIKAFQVPESLPFGYSFMMFAEYVIDRVPQFQSVSGVRKGSSLIDAVAKAEKEVPYEVQWPEELWALVCKTLESEEFQMPRNFLVRSNIATDQLVPLRFYLPFVDAIKGAGEPKPKSMEVDESQDQAASSRDTAAA